MKFGQGDSHGVSRKLPPLDRDPLRASAPATSAKLEVLLGAPIWGCAGWKGTLYPEKARVADFLKHYGEALPAIELNATFYGIPTADRLEKWAADTPETFKFCPKVPRGASHSSDMKTRLEVFDRFWKEFEVLGSRWGLSFLQLPETFDTRSLRVLETLLKHKPEQAALAVEFRHPGWFSDHALISEAKGLLEFYNVTATISDTLAKRHSLHQSFVSSETMIRFLGTEDPTSDMPRLTEWVDRLEEVSALGVKRAYVFIHQPHEEFCAETLARLSDLILTRPALHLAKPVKLFSESQPELFV
ncbi:MAG: DUF72 domain-containing protein [Bdellovibrionota bacterium]